MRRSNSPQIIFCLLPLIFGVIVLNAQELIFKKHSIDNNFLGIQCVKIVDLDNDGDLDIIGGSEITPNSSSKGIAWWCNNGGSLDSWTKFTIDASFIHVMSVDAAFINSDSSLDIVASSWQLNEIAWWEKDKDTESGWTKHIIKTNYTNAHDAQCVDIDLDGDIDIITVSSTPGSIDICYNNSGEIPAWSYVQLTSNFTGAKSVKIIDLDSDNDLDIIGTADESNMLAWWENTGDNSQIWSKKIIDANFIGSCFVDVIDINKNSKLDVIGSAWSSNQLAYWLCNDYSTNSWSKHIVTTNLDIAVRSYGCDIDLDGDIDVIAIGKIPGEFVIYYNDSFNWSKHVLEYNFTGGAALELIDFDNDGDIDIVAGAGGLGVITLYENLNTYTTGINNEDEPEIEFLNQNYPNPFCNYTTFSWYLPSSGLTDLRIYSSEGNEVAILFNGVQLQGKHQLIFNGQSLPAGIYYCVLKTTKYSQTKKSIITD